MSRRRPTAIGKSRVRLARGVRSDPPRVEEMLYRPLAQITLTCDGRPGIECDKPLVVFGCDSAPASFEDVRWGVSANGELSFDDSDPPLNVELICASCEGVSVLLTTARIVRTLELMVDTKKRKLRVSCRALAAQSC